MDPAVTSKIVATPEPASRVEVAGTAVHHRRWVPLVAGFVAAVALVALAVTVSVSRSGRERSVVSTMESGDLPLNMAAVAAPIAARYTAATSHEEHFRQVRCFCGCEKFADRHESLWQCFVRPDGLPEAHAAGCGVCLAEADVVIDRIAAGVPMQRVAAEIVTQFGPRPDLTGEN